MTTVAPPTDPLAFDKLLSSSWALFRRNWIISLPLVLAVVAILACVAILVVVAAVAIAGTAAAKDLSHMSGGVAAVLVFSYLGLVLVIAVAMWWAYVAMYGMADAAWERGTATLADGNAAFRRAAIPALVATIGLVFVAIAAVIVALPTLGLSLLALPLLTMYVLPAVVSGRRGGIEAIGDSFRLVRRFFVPSLIAVLVLVGIQYAIGMLGAVGIVPLEFAALPTGAGKDAPLVVPPIPLLIGCGLIYLLSLLVGLVYTGFYAIALVGLYRQVSGRAAAAPAAAASPIVLP